MKKYFLDANVIIDALVGRNIKETGIEELLASRDQAEIYISALTMHIVFYVLKVKYGSEIFKKICGFLDTAKVIPLTEDVLVHSIAIEFRDFEDTLQYFSAVNNCDYILTRDTKDFEYIKQKYPSNINILSKYVG